jgi:hypothetical protein
MSEGKQLVELNLRYSFSIYIPQSKEYLGICCLRDPTAEPTSA